MNAALPTQNTAARSAAEAHESREQLLHSNALRGAINAESGEGGRMARRSVVREPLAGPRSARWIRPAGRSRWLPGAAPRARPRKRDPKSAREKVERYRILAGAATAPDVVVFCFPSEAREASARQVLGGTPMPVATATLDRHLADPFGAIWLPLHGDRRVRLIDLRTWTPV